MPKEDIDIIESENDATEEVENTEEVEEVEGVEPDETEDESDEDVEAIKAQNKKLFERAKKAEAEAKALKAKKPKEPTDEQKPVEKQTGITPIDTIALMTAKVTEQEDIEFVAEYAQFKGISVAEALKSSVVKTEMADRQEKRATAEATNTGTARRGTSKPTAEAIMSNVEKGKFPENPEDLAEARFNAKFKK